MPVRRRLLPPDPLGITPSSQRRLDGRPKEWLADLPEPQVDDQGKAHSGARRAITKAGPPFGGPTSNPRIEKALGGLFAPSRKEKKMTEATTTRRVRRATKKAADATDALVTKAPAQKQAEKVARQHIPEMSTPFVAIRKSVFTLPDPDGVYKRLEEDISLREALTPGALQEALNRAEDNARLAHKLYVNARADFDQFEHECQPIIESMRDAANKELQAEKDKKLRSKAITDADVKGRASQLFTDEWSAIAERRIKAEGMLDHLKALAELWKNRCYSLNGMLNSGKRS